MLPASSTALLTAVVLLFPMINAQGEVPTFADDMEEGSDKIWHAHGCDICLDDEMAHSGRTSMKIVDWGRNGQAYLLLPTQRGERYTVKVWGYRRAANKGTWHGKIAASQAGGGVSSALYIGQSDFIAEPEAWTELELEFTAPSDRIYLILTGQNETGDVTFFDDVTVFSDGGPMEPIPESLSLETEPLKTVALSGSPEEIGRLWGALNSEAIVHDMEKYYLAPAKENGLDQEELIERAKTFVGIAEAVAPHWLPESKAVARAAGVDEDLYISFVAGVYRNLFLGEECTSYAVSSQFTEKNNIFFHKNRDNAPKTQSAFLLDSNLQGVNRFMAVTDASVIACMMMVNDKGLAGSADTGGLPVKKPRYRGMMNTSLLRLVAEKASTCGEALQLVEEFVEKGYYAGGGNTGTHWLFVDAQGTIMEVSNNSAEVKSTVHTGKVYFSARNDTNAPRILEEATTPISFSTFHNVSRDPSMCFDSSISGMSVNIHRSHPDLLTCAWISMPARGLSFPLYMGCREVPIALVSGDVFALSEKVDVHPRIWQRIEASTLTSEKYLEREVKELLEENKREEAQEKVNAWVRDCADSYLAILEGLARPGRAMGPTQNEM